MNTNQNTDLHDLTLPTLPEWGPDVPGTPVEVTYSDGTLGLVYGWRDGRSTIANPDRERRTSPAPWGRARITAVLADDPTRCDRLTDTELDRLECLARDPLGLPTAHVHDALLHGTRHLVAEVREHRAREDEADLRALDEARANDDGTRTPLRDFKKETDDD